MKFVVAYQRIKEKHIVQKNKNMDDLKSLNHILLLKQLHYQPVDQWTLRPGSSILPNIYIICDKKSEIRQNKEKTLDTKLGKTNSDDVTKRCPRKNNCLINNRINQCQLKELCKDNKHDESKWRPLLEKR